MAEITDFKLIGDSKSIDKVRVSMDNGVTWGLLWERDNLIAREFVEIYECSGGDYYELDLIQDTNKTSYYELYESEEVKFNKDNHLEHYIYIWGYGATQDSDVSIVSDNYDITNIEVYDGDIYFEFSPIMSSFTDPSAEGTITVYVLNNAEKQQYKDAIIEFKMVPDELFSRNLDISQGSGSNSGTSYSNTIEVSYDGPPIDLIDYIKFTGTPRTWEYRIETTGKNDYKIHVEGGYDQDATGTAKLQVTLPQTTWFAEDSASINMSWGIPYTPPVEWIMCSRCGTEYDMYSHSSCPTCAEMYVCEKCGELVWPGHTCYY